MSPSNNVPVPLQEPRPALPALLPSTAADEFLPSPGSWSHTLGHRVLIAIVSTALALVVWPWQETVRASGVVRPTGENSLVQSERGGRVLAVLVQPNQRVIAGQVMARLDDRALRDQERQLETEISRLQRQQAEASIQQRALADQRKANTNLHEAQVLGSERELDQARATLSFHERELARYLTLLSVGAVSRSLVDEKAAQAAVSRSDVSKAQQRVAQQQAQGAAESARLRENSSVSLSGAEELAKALSQRRTQLAEVRRDLTNTIIRAPRTGAVIGMSLRHAQQVLRPGEVLASIAPEGGGLDVQVQVPGQEISQVRTGQTAYLRVAGCPFPEFGVLHGRVSALSADTIASSDGQGRPLAGSGYQVVVRPGATELRAGRRRCALRQGMDVQADVVTQRTTVMALLLRKLRLISGA